MQTFKEVFSRKEECRNLKNVGFCVLVVLALVMGAFGLVLMKQVFSEDVRREWVSKDLGHADPVSGME